MAKPKRGGKRSAGVSAGSAATVPAPPQDVAEEPNIVTTPQQAIQANDETFKSTDNSPYHDLYAGGQYYLSQNLTVSQFMASQDYIDPTTLPGSLYNMAQNLNTKLQRGQPLNAQEQYVYSQMLSAMHNGGYNLHLYRYDHANFMNNLLSAAGATGNMDNMSIAQMKTALVGKPYVENRMQSTSYNDFKKAPIANPFTDRQVRIVYDADANTQMMMPGSTRDPVTGRRLDWGEMVLSPTNNYVITDIKEISKTGGRAQGTAWKGARQIEIHVHAYGGGTQ